MSKIKHLLFDCDGVLVDTEYIAAIKMTAALKNLGANVSVEYYLENLSGTTFSSIVKKYFADSLVELEVTELINMVEDQVSAEVKLIDGAEAMLRSVEIAKSVVSNSSMRTVKHAIRATGIESYFLPQVFSSELVEKPKPAPDVYNLAITTLNCAPDEIIVIEDSLSGAKAALAAGLEVIGFIGASHILPGHGQQLINLGVEKIAENMADLSSILQSSIKE